MTDSDIGVSFGTGGGKSAAAAAAAGVTWKWATLPGVRHVEVCDHGGLVRTLPHTTTHGRRVAGKVLTPKRTGTSRYWQVKYTDGAGKVRYRPVGVLVLEAHVGLCPPGQQCCHGDDDPDNNDLVNLRWDDPPRNVADRMRNHPAQPKPAKVCPRCGREHQDQGRRCQGCVRDLGLEAAVALVEGEDPERLAERLEYPSAVGLVKLANRHGGLRLYIDPAVTPGYPPDGYVERPGRRLRRVINARKASRPNSDAR